MRAPLRVLSLLALAAVFGATAAQAAPTPSQLAASGGAWRASYTGATPLFAPSGGSGSFFDPDTGGTAQWYFDQPDSPPGTARLTPFGGLWSTNPASPYGRFATRPDGSLMGIFRFDQSAANFVVWHFATWPTTTSGEGRYVSCGPMAYREPRGGDPGPHYAEGEIAVQPGTSGGPPAPDQSVEEYGALGATAYGESPLCEVARADARLWVTSAPSEPGGQDPGDARRVTSTSVGCNRGPNPGDPFTCTARVADVDGRPGASGPAGRVAWTATGGSFTSGATCTLAAQGSAPTVSICTVTYANPSVGAGSAVPVTAVYEGSTVHKPTRGAHQAAVPEGPRPGSAPQAPIVCGAAPLPSCEGLVPQPGRVVTCIPGGGVTCPGLPPLRQLAVCVANVGGACQGFASGAKLAGIWDTSTRGVPVELVCPAAGSGARSARVRPRQVGATGGGGSGSTRSCRFRTQLTGRLKLIRQLHARASADDRALRARVRRELEGQPLVRRFPERFKLREVLSNPLRLAIVDHNSRISVVNDLIETLTNAEATALGPSVDFVNTIQLDRRADVFPNDFFRRASSKRRPGQRPEPKLVLAARTLSVRAGRRTRTSLAPTRTGRRVLAAARHWRLRSVDVDVRVTATSSTKAFRATTARRAVALRLARAGRR